MTHRRPDPEQARLEELLRRALRTAADSVHPAADGLERIRAKITVSQTLPSSSWAHPARPAAHATSLGRVNRIRATLSAWSARLSAARARTVIASGLGWIRPVAALATGLLVVAAASWMVVALPQRAAPANDTAGLHHSSPPYTTPAAPGATATRHPTSTYPAPTTSTSPSATPSCQTSSARPAASPSSAQAISPSPTTTPTQTPTATPTPSSTLGQSPSTSPTPAAPTSTAARSGSSVTPSSDRNC